MARDKKARESGLVWVLPRSLGEGWMADGIAEGGGPGRAARLPARSRSAAGIGVARIRGPWYPVWQV